MPSKPALGAKYTRLLAFAVSSKALPALSTVVFSVQLVPPSVEYQSLPLALTPVMARPFRALASTSLAPSKRLATVLPTVPAGAGEFCATAVRLRMVWASTGASLMAAMLKATVLMALCAAPPVLPPSWVVRVSVSAPL